ncbi:AAA family ATPase [Bdellovibrionota bacterium FG-2]
MPHERSRFAVAPLKKLASLWPVIGVIGARQVGKSTLVKNQLEIPNQLSLDDDEDVLLDAEASAKVFVSRLHLPVLIDEAQKAPKIFDAIKMKVDKKRVPGQYFLTGSTQFSARLDIRESLTGRIGMLHLHPLTLAELYQRPFRMPEVFPVEQAPRFGVAEISEGLERGGLPYPCFLRAPAARSLYWSSWLETTIYRDIARFFKRSYDPRVTTKILKRAAEAASRGEYFSTQMVSDIQARRLQSYLTAMEDTFLMRRMSCSDVGVGKDHWYVFDSGLLNHLMGAQRSEGATLSLARSFILNEISAMCEYSGPRLELTYYKSMQGTPVDLVWNNVPIKITAKANLKGVGWDTRSLEGAMKKLRSPRAILVAPVDRPVIEKKGVSVLPWSMWS